MNTLASTPRPGATSTAARRQPATTCRAVIHTPASETEKAVPAPGLRPAPGSDRTESPISVGPEVRAASRPDTGGGAGGASARSRSARAAAARPSTTAA